MVGSISYNCPAIKSWNLEDSSRKLQGYIGSKATARDKESRCLLGDTLRADCSLLQTDTLCMRSKIIWDGSIPLLEYDQAAQKDGSQSCLRNRKIMAQTHTTLSKKDSPDY